MMNMQSLITKNLENSLGNNYSPFLEDTSVPMNNYNSSLENHYPVEFSIHPKDGFKFKGSEAVGILALGGLLILGLAYINKK